MSPSKLVPPNVVGLVLDLLDTGALHVTDLRSMDIQHAPDCPMQISARNIICTCRPQVWVHHQLVTQETVAV